MDNIPVFPIRDLNEHPGPLGLTMRDYFAAHAMQGMLANPDALKPPVDKQANAIPAAAYRCADEMLKARG